jgi:hypothetical protein
MTYSPSFYELFGGSIGALLLGIGGCIYKLIQSYEFKYDYERERETSIRVLCNNWETKGEDFPLDKDFGESWNRKGFAKHIDDNWNININRKYGNVFLYRDLDIHPHWEYNKNCHYLRINIKNISKKNKVYFQQKFYTRGETEYDPAGYNINDKEIKYSGENIFEVKSLLNHDNVTKEQIGIFISGYEEEMKNVIIDEAYYGEKWHFWKPLCFGKTILYRKKISE